MTILIGIIISFLLTVFLTPYFIRYLTRINAVVQDLGKYPRTLVPISGGLPVAAGILAGILTLVFIGVFITKNGDSYLSLLAAACSIMIITFIGFMDDLLIHNNQKYSVGLKQWQKPLLTLPAAIPLMAIKAGESMMNVPLFGNVDFGILYALVLVPIGVVGASNMVNLLGGFNGMEAGMGMVYTGMLGLYALHIGSGTAATIAFITFAALAAFLIYNRVPARILPGDSLTYLLGAVLVCIAVLGNMEKACLIVSIPFFVEFILKLRGKFQKTTVGHALPNGKLKSKHSKIYSIPHLMTQTGTFSERQVVYAMIAMELFFASLIWLV